MALMTQKTKKKWKAAIFYILKLSAAILVISPLIYALLMSFLPFSETMRTPPTLISPNMSFANFRDVARQITIFTYFKNTLIVAIVTVSMQILTASLAAYAFTFFSFKGKALVFTLFLSTLMIPDDTTMISNYLTISNLNLIDTYTAIVLPYLASGMSVFLMRQYYITIPKELKESSVIDGCTDMQFWYKIAVPLSIPAIASLGIYAFILSYNHYFWPLLVTNTNGMRTLQVGISMLFSREDGINYALVMAGAMMAVLPAVVIFVLCQKYIIRGMTDGAVKG